MKCGCLAWLTRPISPLSATWKLFQTGQLPLLPIIQRHVLSGTIVHSDEWRSYSQVAGLPGVQSHQTVNHYVTFVDNMTGAHTQNIESYWNCVKLKLKKMKGCHSHQIPSYLDEFMWRERFGETSSDSWRNIMLHIAHRYPV